MTGAEFKAKLQVWFPIRDTDEHEESYWWLLLQETAERQGYHAYKRDTAKEGK